MRMTAGSGRLHSDVSRVRLEEKAGRGEHVCNHV